MKRFGISVLVILLAMILTSCTEKTFDASPEEVEEAMLSSFMDGDSDALIALVCEDEGTFLSALTASEGATVDIECVREDTTMTCSMASPGEMTTYFDFEIVGDRLCNMSITAQ